MNYNDFKNNMNDVKSGNDLVQFATDPNTKAHQYLGKVFERMNSQNSNSQLLPTNLGQKVVFNIHKDDLAKVFYCLDRIYQKTKDDEIIGWVNDIKYHLMHHKKDSAK